ncbi:MAG: hypothetical protein JSS71_03000 [Armatimonadetes bacterium]|nr:hypothetical protein [Armatimonadota bacterium]MBX3108350.1 hypothetical protein [Fimbriimonadaceae bacterium]
MRAVTAIAGTIVVAGALGVAIAQNKAVAESNAPEPIFGKQEMTATQMLNYMKEQGTKYIVETTEIPKDKKFEVNLASADRDEIARAVAKALGLSASKEGDVWVLKDGPDFGAFPMLPNGGKEWDQMTPEEKAEFEKGMAEFRKSMQEFGESMKNFRFDFHMPDMDFHMPDMDFKFNGKDFDKMTPEEKAEFDKEMAKMKEELKNMKFEFKGFDKDEFDKEMGRVKIEIDKAKQEAGKAREEAKKAMKIHVENMEKLFASVSDRQWELMKSQGYLKLSDLTKEQREMLGNPQGDDEFNMTIERNGKKLVIRG